MASAYTDEQIDQYVEYISLPPEYHPSANPARDLEFLTVLHAYQLSAIPYENLSLHYSRDHAIPLDPQTLFRKFMRNGRGGYCMEISIFFNRILRALGFKAYTAGARIRLRVNGVPQGNYVGWRHIVNIVTVADGAKYMVDVGFGGDGAIKPIPLVDGLVTRNIGRQELRLEYGNIPQQSDKSQRLWIYQYRNDPALPWNSFYCFPELEFFEEDFRIMNHFTSTHPDSFQKHIPLVIKFLRRGREIYGKVMLVTDQVKQNLGGKTSVVKVCRTEDERVDALKEYLGITITDEEREGIRAWETELPRE